MTDATEERGGLTADAHDLTPSPPIANPGPVRAKVVGVLTWCRQVLVWRDFLAVDIAIAVVSCAAWVWFAYQYGYNNSPDSWYRGVLGKSIAAGHPYWINMKQGYLYDYGPWHHDAAHEPLLPALYALYFLVFGNKIIIANIISSLAAGLLIYPLLRIGRTLFKSAWVAFPVYVAVAFNEKVSFLFETTAGLSIPTSALLLVTFLLCLHRVIERPMRRWIVGGALSAAGYYYVRGDNQLVLVGLMAFTLAIGALSLERESYRRMCWMWLLSFCLVAPWILRKCILFHSPFFTHITAALWTDRGYDYWTYHETIPLPSSASYFKTHTLGDFGHKVFVKGFKNVGTALDRISTEPVWCYLVSMTLSVGATLFLRDRRRQLVLLSLWMACIGYLAIYVLSPFLDNRYFIPIYLILSLSVAAPFFLAFGRWMGGVRGFLYGGVVSALLLSGVVWIQKDFWRTFKSNYIRHAYQTSDERLAKDPLIAALRKRFTPSDVILGPFADVQRLSFATGLTFVEPPDNLKNLNDPAAFFEKYKIRYSLVDVRRVLPKEMMEDVELVGGRVVYTIGSGKGLRKADLFAGVDVKEESEIAKGIANGISNRVAYVDGCHAGVPPDTSFFRDAGVKAFAYKEGFQENQKELFQSGLLIMQYGMKKTVPSEEEYAIIKRFVTNGGRVLLVCPAWVWGAYEKQPIEELPYHRIARLFGVLMTADCSAGPYRIVDSSFQVPGVDRHLKGTFSSLVFNEGRTLVAGQSGDPVAVAVQRGNTRTVVWAQNNLFGELVFTPEGGELLKRLFDWLFQQEQGK